MCASMTCSQLVDAYLTSVIDCMYDTWLHTVRMKYLAGCILLVIPPRSPFLTADVTKAFGAQASHLSKMSNVPDSISIANGTSTDWERV